MGNSTTAAGIASTGDRQRHHGVRQLLARHRLAQPIPLAVTQANTMAIMGGKVGIGTAAPYNALDVNGAVKIGNTTDPCGANYSGTIRYNGGSHRVLQRERVDLRHRWPLRPSRRGRHHGPQRPARQSRHSRPERAAGSERRERCAGHDRRDGSNGARETVQVLPARPEIPLGKYRSSDTYYTAGNVGIGTSVPSSKFQVELGSH